MKQYLKTRQHGTRTMEHIANLDAQDRCDVGKCGAAAATVAIVTAKDEELLFCAHHTRQHHDALVDQGALLYTKEA